ncbi:MAG TPA: flotillin domain-containing protein, partial [Candidatus Limnocylindria bacterium]|nr:flotillin domain-containing protein [Candidatus Limnocylindria bacterium]
GPLAQAEAQQEVTRRQTELADLEAGRKEKELLTSTVRPAEADAEAVVKRADGDRLAKIAAAQAEAERQRLAGEAEARVAILKGEAQARVVSLNADAEAHRTQVEGNAEAEITLTQGEAAAKALALRAEAYKQFNEAAVIQTVLSMLPDIVRAAAEPMSNIGSLTVLSSDGASEVVKTTTRTVAEAGAAVKSLTGLDVPALINEAVGRQSRATTAPPQTADGPPRRGAKTAGSAPPSPSRSFSAEAPSRRDRSETAATEPPTAERFAEAVDTIEAAGTLPAAAEASPEEPSISLPDDASADEAAAALASALDRVPAVRRYADMPLGELANRGPRRARGLWAAVPERLREELGRRTVAELLERRTEG